MISICVFTSTRADFGILNPLVRMLALDRAFDLRLFVTGTHLLPEHGQTVEEIEKGGFKIRHRVPISMSDDPMISHLETMGEALVRFSKELAEDKPDVAVVLGDRYEALSFAIAANGLGIPLVHLHGGEVTEGALDDSYRHCITKLSFLHFVANEKYRQRVIQMGESPERVYDVGALGVDNILSIPLLSLSELSQSLGFEFKEEILAVTYHPETTNPDKDWEQVTAMLEALQKRINIGSTSLVFTRANADSGNEKIHKKIEDFVKVNSSNCIYVQSLGMKRYLSLLQHSDVVVGNSSSGIIEAPAVGTPTVNVGDRQKGREMAQSVFNVHGSSDDIYRVLEHAIAFKQTNSGRSFSVYGDGMAAGKILNILKSVHFSPFLKKTFFDLR